MSKIVDIHGLQIAADNWNPRCEIVNSIEECANLINLPHEDYPLFVEKTHESILLAIEILKDSDLREFDMKALHGFCMKEKDYIITGSYRTQTGVMVGSFEPPHPMYVPQLMMSIFPVNKDIEDIEMWYRLFECIHPFEDGNGRLGGIILAAVSFLKDGTYKVPKRHTKETLRLAEIKHVFQDGCLYNLKQPAIVLENGLGNDILNKKSYYNQVNGIMCHQHGFDGVLYVLPYQFVRDSPFDPENWPNDESEIYIKIIEKTLVLKTEIEEIIIDKKLFKEASAYCRVKINDDWQNAWLTWENCD